VQELLQSSTANSHGVEVLLPRSLARSTTCAAKHRSLLLPLLLLLWW
jgi:hypothetical protein